MMPFLTGPMAPLQPSCGSPNLVQLKDTRPKAPSPNGWLAEVLEYVASLNQRRPSNCIGVLSSIRCGSCLEGLASVPLSFRRLWMPNKA